MGRNYCQAAMWRQFKPHQFVPNIENLSYFIFLSLTTNHLKRPNQRLIYFTNMNLATASYYHPKTMKTHKTCCVRWHISSLCWTWTLFPFLESSSESGERHWACSETRFPVYTAQRSKLYLLLTKQSHLKVPLVAFYHITWSSPAPEFAHLSWNYRCLNFLFFWALLRNFLVFAVTSTLYSPSNSHSIVDYSEE